MIYVTLKDQLGNQMFAYIAIKSFALRKEFDFGVVCKSTSNYNSTDDKYGTSLVTIFNIPKEEVILDIPNDIEIYKELPLSSRKGEYWKIIDNIPDNTLFDGHFISSKYFTYPKDTIKSWLSLPQEKKKMAQIEIENIKQKHGSQQCCSVHFRCGNDYYRGGI